MIQAKSSPGQEILPDQSPSFPPHLPDQNEDYPEDDNDYDEEDSQDFYQDEEYEEEDEDEDSPTVYYNLPTKKPDKKQEKLKAEKLKERNQQLQEKKEQARSHPIEPLNLLEASEKDYSSFKKVSKFHRSSALVQIVLEIPDKNLLVILLQGGVNVRVYNTLNFKLVTVAKAQRQVKCMSYCQKLGRIIVGGIHDFLQLWSPKTFKVEAEYLQRKNWETILSASYAAKSNVIVAKMSNKIRIYTTGLRMIKHFSMPLCMNSWYSDIADIFSLSKNLLLTVNRYGSQRVPILFNIKTGNSVDCSKTAFIPMASSVTMTEKSPVKIFSCLGMFNGKPVGEMNDNFLYPLIQFTVDTKTEQVVPLRTSDDFRQTFCKLICIENSKYFLAERYENNMIWKICLLSINKDQIEILRVVSKPPSILLKKLNTYTMLKDRLSVIEVNEQNVISVYKSVLNRDKPKNITA